jgi:hypothetical protein
MPVTMNPAMAALCGSLVGALGSSASTWITQRHADQRDLLARKIFYRVQLYSDFIAESERILVDALENNSRIRTNLYLLLLYWAAFGLLLPERYWRAQRNW